MSLTVLAHVALALQKAIDMANSRDEDLPERRLRSEFRRGPKRAKKPLEAKKVPGPQVPFGGFGPVEAAGHRTHPKMANLAEHGRGLNFELTRTILVAGRRWRKLANERIRQHGQSMARLEILYLVSRTGRELNQRQLARLISVDESAIIHLLNALAKEGLIERRQSEKDRRVTVNVITSAGLTKMQEMMVEVSSLRDEVCAGFNDEQIGTVVDFLGEFLTKLEELT